MLAIRNLGLIAIAGVLACRRVGYEAQNTAMGADGGGDALAPTAVDGAVGGPADSAVNP